MRSVKVLPRYAWASSRSVAACAEREFRRIGANHHVARPFIDPPDPALLPACYSGNLISMRSSNRTSDQCRPDYDSGPNDNQPERIHLSSIHFPNSEPARPAVSPSAMRPSGGRGSSAGRGCGCRGRARRRCRSPQRSAHRRPRRCRAAGCRYASRSTRRQSPAPR
jgi:hypothetical protein